MANAFQEEAIRGNRIQMFSDSKCYPITAFPVQIGNGWVIMGILQIKVGRPGTGFISQFDLAVFQFPL